MFWTAFLIRVLYITLAHTYHFRSIQTHFQFGWEMGRIARALVTGFGYADPFDGHTGPTAWTAPLYPLLIAAIFRLFGVYTAFSAWVLLVCNSVLSALTAPAIFEIAKRCFGRRADGRKVALWSGWLWALYPAAMQYAVRWPWEMTLTTCLFAWALVLSLRLGEVGLAGEVPSLSLRPWLLLGMLWGAIALSNSSLLLFLPCQLLWLVYRRRAELAPVLTRAAVCCLVVIACVAPWTWRNYRALHAFVPLRANFGAELYQAALPSNDGFPWGPTVPIWRDDPDLRHYAAVGEVAYSREQGRRAMALIHADPASYFAHVLLRVQFFWVSVPHPADKGVLLEAVREADFCLLSLSGLLGLALAVRKGVPAAWLFVAAFATLPLVYYFITVGARFRHPLEPLITIFSVYLFQNADRSRAFSFFGSRVTPAQQVTAST